jgi:dipeptidyl aminopeptidase/acylaminoacyl peptidase
MKFASRMTAIAAVALSFAGIASARPFTPKDLVTLERLTDPRISPDGRYALYDLRTVNYDANRAAHEIWVVDLTAKNAAPRRLAASDGGASSARWAPDSHGVYFLSSRNGGVSQVFHADVTAEGVTQTTNLPFDVGAYRVSPDGKSLVVSLAVFPDCDTLACTQERLAARKANKATGVVYDRLFVRHWDTWADGTRNHLFALTLDEKGLTASGEHDITKGFDGDVPGKPFNDDSDFVFTPDGKGVVFSARLAGKTEAWSTNFDLWQAPLDGSAALVDLTADNQALDTGPIFSPDGSKLAWRAMKRPTFEADRLAIRVKDLKTGVVTELLPNWDRSAESLAWSKDGKTLFVTTEDVGQVKLFAVDLKTMAVKPLTGDGHVAAVDVGPKGLIYAQDALDKPAQLFSMDLRGGHVAQLTQINASQLADVKFGAYEQFSFPGWNGETVHGYVVKPANFDPAKKYPVAFLIHGGPQGSFGNNFHYRWNAETYAGAGYAVVMIDFHGSTGYGQAFTDAISQHWGDRPLEDLQKGWAYAVGKYGFLDADRACALGGSYGGFMINWIAGNWENSPFKCLVNHDGIFDARFMGASTEELWFSEWENGGSLAQNMAGYEKFNPINHIAAWKTPMLVVEGGKDFRVPLEEAIGTFTTLQRAGIESKFLYFPDENHWVLKPQNSVLWHTTVFDWLDAHTGNKREQ